MGSRFRVIGRMSAMSTTCGKKLVVGKLFEKTAYLFSCHVFGHDFWLAAESLDARQFPEAASPTV